jgi:hypothetical protein
MTIRCGVNPVGQMYTGQQSAITLAQIGAFGDVSLRLVASGTGTKKQHGSGNISLRIGPIEVVAVHPVYKHVIGDVVMPAQGVSGTSTFIGHPSGQGNVALRTSVAGTARRRFPTTGSVSHRLVIGGLGEVNSAKTGNGDVVLPKLLLDGEAIVIQAVTGSGDVATGRILITGQASIRRHITATGALSIGPITIKDIPQAATVEIVTFEGHFPDVLDFEGYFPDSIDFEGYAG